MASHSVSQTDINDLKSLSAPPQLVKDTLAAALHVLGYPPEQAGSWPFIKSILGKKGVFLEKLGAFDAKTIPLTNARAAKQLLGSTTVAKAKSVTLAIVGLFLWTEKAIADVEACGGAEGNK